MKNQEIKNQDTTTLAIKNLTSIGGIIINPKTEEGFFTIKLADDFLEAKTIKKLIQEKQCSIGEILKFQGLSFAKGKNKTGENYQETLYREIKEELGIKKQNLENIGNLGYFRKYRKYYTKYIIMDLLIILNDQKNYLPKDPRHLPYKIDLQNALRYLKSPEEKKFLEEHMDTIFQRIKNYKNKKKNIKTPETIGIF